MLTRTKITLALSVLLVYLALLAAPQQAHAAVVKKLAFSTKQLYMLTSSNTSLDNVGMRVVATWDNGLEEDVTDQCTLTSTKTTIFTVSGQTINAVAKGTASLSATYGGKTAKASILVIDPVQGITLSAPTNLIMQKGDSLSVKATLVFSGTGIKPIDVTKYCTWESEDDDIVSVNSGKLKALDLTSGVGVKVTASFNLPGATITPPETTVTVINPIKSIVAEPFSLLGTAGGSSPLVIKPFYKDGSTGSDVTSNTLFSSTNIKVATVNGTGQVTFVAAGTACIKASYAGKTVSVPVRVLVDLNNIIPSATDLQLVAGSTSAIKFKKGTSYVTSYVSLSSDDTTVAKTSPGKIIAVDPGDANITYKYGGTEYGPITVHVIKKVSSLSVNPSAINAVAGEKAQITLTAVYADKTSGQVTGTYTSADTAIATVDATGMVTGGNVLAMGSTKITATFAGKSVTVPVTILPSNFGAITFSTSSTTGGTITPDNITFTVTSGSTLKIYAQALFGIVLYNHSSPVTDITSKCVWTSEDTSVATVNNGVISMKKAGVVRINATFGGKSNSFLLNVWQSISEITATPDSLAFFGSTDDPKDITSVLVKYADGTLRDAQPSELSWTSGDTSLVTVDNQGEVSLATPFKTGSTTVTGDFAGKKVTVNVSVNPELTSISTSTNSIDLIEGTSATFKVLAYYGINYPYSEVTSDCTYTTVSDSVYGDIAKITVDPTEGTITAQAGAPTKGHINIDLQGKNAQIAYTVIPKPTELGLELSPDSSFGQIIANNGTFYFNTDNQGTTYNIYVHTTASPSDDSSRITANSLLSVFSSNNSIADVGGTYTLDKGASATTGSTAVVTAFFAGKTFKFTVAIDLSAPAQPSEDGSADKDGTTQSKDFNIIVNAETGTSVTAVVGGSSVLKNSSTVTAAAGKATLPIDITKLAEGPNAIEITATDPAGNTSPTLTVNVTKDTTKPSITVGATSVDNGGDTITVTFNEDPKNDADQVTNKVNWTLQYADDTSDTSLTTIVKTNAAFNYNALSRALTITLDEATDQAFIPDNKYVKVTPHATNISDLYGNAGIEAVLYTATPVTAETGTPTVATDWNKTDATHFTITYSDVLELTAATNTANWTYVDSNSGGVTISAVTVDTDGMTVTVTLSGSIETGDTLQPTTNITDLAGNSVTSTTYTEP